jgi:hypothetical protein
MDLKLDFIFTCVYIGKIKGTPKGCVTVSKSYNILCKNLRNISPHDCQR